MGALSMTEKKAYKLDQTAEVIEKVIEKSEATIKQANNGVTYLRRQTREPDAEASNHFIEKLDNIVKAAEEVKAKANEVIENVESFKRWIEKAEDVRTWEI